MSSTVVMVTFSSPSGVNSFSERFRFNRCLLSSLEKARTSGLSVRVNEAAEVRACLRKSGEVVVTPVTFLSTSMESTEGEEDVVVSRPGWVWNAMPVNVAGLVRGTATVSSL